MAVGGDRSLETTVTEKRRTVQVNCQLATKRCSDEVRAATLSFLDGQERHHASAAVCALRKVTHGRRLLVREEPSCWTLLDLRRQFCSLATLTLGHKLKLDVTKNRPGEQTHKEMVAQQKGVCSRLKKRLRPPRRQVTK
jgi:hypothetical protein